MAKKLTTITLFTVLMLVGGYVLYFISNILPLPGSKFIVMGPYLTFVMTIPVIRYPRFGTISIMNCVFGGLMLIYTPWMTLAIVLSGIAADFMMLLPIKQKGRLLMSMGLYNGMSLLTSVVITNFITGNAIYRIMNIPVLLGVFILAFITGSVGGYAGIKLNNRYLKREIQ